MRPENHDEDEIKALLREAFPPTDTELPGDLWPAMLRRMEKPAAKVPWYDWALAACVVAVAVIFPRLALFFAYHL